MQQVYSAKSSTESKGSLPELALLVGKGYDFSKRNSGASAWCALLCPKYRMRYEG